jgi:hypothetical protein
MKAEDAATEPRLERRPVGRTGKSPRRGERAGSLGTLDNYRRNKRPDLTFNKVLGSGLPPRLGFHIVLVLEFFPISRASRVKNYAGQFCLAGALLSRNPPAI